MTRRQPITRIDQLLRSLHREKLVYSMWNGPNMDVLEVESQLIELRTRCERNEVTASGARAQLEPLRTRVRRLVRKLRRHPSYTQRMVRIAPPRQLAWHAASAVLIVLSTVMIVMAAY